VYAINDVVISTAVRKKFVNNVMVLLECAFIPLTFVIIFLKTTILKLFMFQTFFFFNVRYLYIGDNYFHELRKLKNNLVQY